MALKAADSDQLFLTVEFINPTSSGAQGMLYFKHHYESEVLRLLNCDAFWNELNVAKPSTQRFRMFPKLEPNAIECSNEWNSKTTSMATVMKDITEYIPRETSYTGVFKGAKSNQNAELSVVRDNLKNIIEEVWGTINNLETKVEDCQVSTRASSNVVKQ